MLYHIRIYFLWFVIYSVIGWMYESIYCSIENKKLMNRGFFNGPYCPIYGSGAILNLLFLNRSMHPVLIFLSAALITGMLEYLTSYVMELLFDARWWDYSDKRFNLNGRVFLLGIIAFGCFSLLLIEYLHPLVSRYTAMFSDDVLSIISLIAFTLILIDAVFTLTKLIEFKEYLKLASAGLDNALQSVKFIYEKAGDKVSNGIRRIHPQIRRMLLSFPKLKSYKYNKIIVKLRERIAKEIETLKKKKEELLKK